MLTPVQKATALQAKYWLSLGPLLIAVVTNGQPDNPAPMDVAMYDSCTGELWQTLIRCAEPTASQLALSGVNQVEFGFAPTLAEVTISLFKRIAGRQDRKSVV